MYKIHTLLLLLTLAMPFALRGQQMPDKPLTIAQRLKALSRNSLPSHPGVNEQTPARLTSEASTNRKTVFTAHLLTDQVEPGKKCACDVLSKGQKVSLPYLTPLLIQSLCLWQTVPTMFCFAVAG